VLQPEAQTQDVAEELDCRLRIVRSGTDPGEFDDLHDAMPSLVAGGSAVVIGDCTSSDRHLKLGFVGEQGALEALVE
jgi:hypothetical protein